MASRLIATPHSEATPARLELPLTIADRGRLFNGIVGSGVGVDLSVRPPVGRRDKLQSASRKVAWADAVPRQSQHQASSPDELGAWETLSSAAIVNQATLSGPCRRVRCCAFWLFTGNVVSQPEILIGLIVPSIAVLNESPHALQECGTDIPRPALWVGEAKIGTDEQALV